MQLAYVKTGKGREEIEKRTNHIGFRHRTALILVDGTSPAEELLAKIPGDGRTLLADLLRDGYIALPEGTTAAPAQPETPTGDSPVKSGFDLAVAKREAVKYIEAVLGPGGESLALAIERSNNLSDFTKQAQRTRDIISQVGGSRKAADFWSKIGL